jgi:CubicO group peptidase (beta-lactamase class C family)
VDVAKLFDSVDGDKLERFGVTALAVGVLSGGEHSVRGYGAAQPETMFRVASITKPIVAATALRLVQEGRLALDEPLTELRLPWYGITLRHLLSHQAGLAAALARPVSDYGDGEDAFQRLVGDDAVVAGPVGPGELFAYSNPGYWLTGALVERASGLPFEEALHNLVLEPLGMERTGFAPVEPSVPSSIPYPRARRPSGGLWSCADDLLRIAAHLLGGPGPLGSATVREMQTPQIAVGPDGDYGLGIGLVRGRGRRTVEHGGAVEGIRSQLLLAPDEATAFVFLTDSDRGQFLIDELLAALGLDLPLPPEVTVGDEVLAAVSGTFREPLGTAIRVAARDAGIDLALVDGERSSHLRPASPTRFVAREGDEKGDWAEFFQGGRLMRYDTLFERVG